jgi:hypothetical protein
MTTSRTGGIGAASSLTQDAILLSKDGVVEKVHGTIAVKARDVSDLKSAQSGDKLDFAVARIHIPSTNALYEVRFTGLDRTSDLSHFGGVGLVKPMFGDTGIGEANIPKAIGYLTVYGLANISRDGSRIATNIPAQIAVVPGIWDVKTEKFVSEGDIDYSVRMIGLHVYGDVEGVPGGLLMVGWPKASVSLNEIGGRVLAANDVLMARLPGEPMRGRVLGVAGQPQRISILLGNSGFARFTPPTPYSGLVTFKVTNNTRVNRGLIIKGKDLLGSPFFRQTPLLRPGQSTTFQVYLAPGSFRLREFHRYFSGGELIWASSYATTIGIRAM